MTAATRTTKYAHSGPGSTMNHASKMHAHGTMIALARHASESVGAMLQVSTATCCAVPATFCLEHGCHIVLRGRQSTWGSARFVLPSAKHRASLTARAASSRRVQFGKSRDRHATKVEDWSQIVVHSFEMKCNSMSSRQYSERSYERFCQHCGYAIATPLKRCAECGCSVHRGLERCHRRFVSAACSLIGCVVFATTVTSVSFIVYHQLESGRSSGALWVSLLLVLLIGCAVVARQHLSLVLAVRSVQSASILIALIVSMPWLMPFGGWAIWRSVDTIVWSSRGACLLAGAVTFYGEIVCLRLTAGLQRRPKEPHVIVAVFYAFSIMFWAGSLMSRTPLIGLIASLWLVAPLICFRSLFLLPLLFRLRRVPHLRRSRKNQAMLL